MNKSIHRHCILTIISVLVFVLGQQGYVKAQEIKGIVHELESSQRLKDVLVKNLRTNVQTHSDAEGNFNIAGNINDLLTFSQDGYDTDTAFIYEEGIQRIYLVRDNKSIVIDEVVISKLTDSRLVSEIAKAKTEGQAAEASQNKGGLRVSPSRLFGRKGKLARKNLDMLIAEQRNRKIDRMFSNQTIRSVVPLTDTDLPLFREQFRPTLQFIETASPEDVRVYILDSYSKFKANK